MSEAKGSFLQSSADVLPPSGHGQIILCDCNGTLFDAAHMKGLNRPLLDFLIAAEERGYTVTLHSGDPQGNIDTYVKLFCISGKTRDVFAPFIAARESKGLEVIEYKGEIPSFKACLTIDDQHGGEYISMAKRQWEPNDPRIAATMESWGLGAAPGPAAAPTPAVPPAPAS